MQESTHDLTSAIASGDTEALGRFYKKWFDFLYAEARKVTRSDEQECLDLVHDVMIKLITSLKPMQHEGQLVQWLRTVVRSCAYDRLRQQISRRQRELAQRNGSVQNYTSDDELAELHEQLQWLRTELESLDPRELQLLLMRHRFSWTLQQIGSRVGLSPSAVDGRINRLINRLRKKRAAEELADE